MSTSRLTAPAAVSFLAVFLLIAVAVTPRSAHAEVDRSAASAVFLIEQSLTPSPRGTHNVILRALRHLDDPTLQPLFRHLADHSEGSAKVHGILGLAELSDPPRIDLKRIAPLTPVGLQAEAISAAQDAQLLTLDQCKAIAGWSGVDPGIALILAARLIQEDQWNDTAVLKELLKSDRLSRRTLAAAMLMQLGDDSAMPVLNELKSTNDRLGASVLNMILESAGRWELNRLGPWAMTVAQDPTIELKLRVNALNVAMRFRTPGSVALWQELFDSSSDLAHKNRLAIAALKLSPWTEAAPFEHLKKQDDALLQAIGSAGLAVVNQANIAPAVVGLIEQNHPLCNDWALTYGADKARGQDRDLVLLSLILAYENGPDRGREQRLDLAASAVQGLVELSPERAPMFLRPMLHSTDTPERLRTGMLLGLIRAREGNTKPIITGWKNTGLPLIDGLALMLLAQQDAPLDDDALADLGLLARGGGGLDLGLRAQAAWHYVKRTGQAQATLDAALNSR